MCSRVRIPGERQRDRTLGREGLEPPREPQPSRRVMPPRASPGRNVCCHRSLRQGNIFQGKKKGLPVYSAPPAPAGSVAVLFCRRRDTELEEERRQRWESFKKLWLRLFHPLEKGLGSCKTAGAAKQPEAAFGGEGGFPSASKSQLHIPGEALWDVWR